MSFEEIEAEWLETYMGRMCTWAATTFIPTRFDENLEPPPETSEPVPCLVNDTKLLYLGKHLKEIWAEFPNHPDYKNLTKDEYPKWWTEMRQEFKKLADRFYINERVDGYTFGTRETRPLYMQNQHRPALTISDNQDATTTDDFISMIDLELILVNILKSSGSRADNPFEKRAWLNNTANAVGRPGEVKYLDYTLWRFDPYLRVTDAAWTEIKTVGTYSMAMVPDMRWIFDWYHSMGSYWLMEAGLFRTSQQIAQGKKNAVFPALHAIKPYSVATKLTKLIRCNLPPSTPREIKTSISAKSLRVGSITAMCQHPKMRVLDVCARSGHSTQTNVDSYRHLSDVVSTIPGALALQRAIDIRAPIELFTFDALDQSANYKNLIDVMFACNIERFQAGGELRPVLITAAASLVAFHNHVTKDLGQTNPLTKKMREVAIKAKIKCADPLLQHLRPEKVLEKWSATIFDDFKTRWSASPSTEPHPTAIAEKLDAVCGTMIAALSELKEIKKDFRALKQENHQMAQRSIDLESVVARLQEQNDSLRTAIVAEQNHQKLVRKRMRAAYESPSPSSHNKRRRGMSIELIGENLMNSIEEEDEEELHHTSEAKAASAAAVARRSSPTVSMMRERDDTAAIKTPSSKKDEGGCGKCERLYDCLILLHKTNRLDEDKLRQSQLKNIKQLGIGEPSRLRYSLELCDFAILRQPALEVHKSNLLNPLTSETDILKAAYAIETAAFQELFAFDGKTLKENEADALARNTRSYNALGRKVLIRKTATQKLPEYSTMKAAETPILSREDLAERQRTGSGPMDAFVSPP